MESVSDSTSQAQNAQVKVPERVYDVYSWKQHSPDARLVYIRDPKVVEQELSRIQPGPLGFDLEWKPNYVKGQAENPVAVVQLASEDTVLLIQADPPLAEAGFPAALQNMLENPKFPKAGVSILNDCKKLWHDYGINVRNCIDLGLLARTVDNAQWKGKYSNPIGLARLCETYHELTLAKGKVQRSNWEAVLTPLQQEYAANDCHSGLTLLKKLFPRLATIDPTPLPAFYSFDVFQGYPYQPSISPVPVTLWQPHNPFYDPGPPPPPKPPKERKPKEGESSTAASGSRATSSTSRGRPNWSVQPRAPLVTPAVPRSELRRPLFQGVLAQAHMSSAGPGVQGGRGGPPRPGRAAYGRGRGRGRGGFLTPFDAADSDTTRRMEQR